MKSNNNKKKIRLNSKRKGILFRFSLNLVYRSPEVVFSLSRILYHHLTWALSLQFGYNGCGKWLFATGGEPSIHLSTAPGLAFSCTHGRMQKHICSSSFCSTGYVLFFFFNETKVHLPTEVSFWGTIFLIADWLNKKLECHIILNYFQVMWTNT